MKLFIPFTLEDYFTSSGKYPERAKSVEITEEVKNNAKNLLSSVNNLLSDLEFTTKQLLISSGFRPSDINAQIKNSAKKSLHTSGMAIDIVDPKDSLDDLLERLEKGSGLLKAYGLWLEDPDNTPRWVHLDISRDRMDRAIRIFKP